MDRGLVNLSDEQWALIRSTISETALRFREEGEGPVNDVALTFRWCPVGRVVELQISGGPPIVIEDTL